MAILNGVRRLKSELAVVDGLKLEQAKFYNCAKSWWSFGRSRTLRGALPDQGDHVRESRPPSPKIPWFRRLSHHAGLGKNLL